MKTCFLPIAFAVVLTACGDREPNPSAGSDAPRTAAAAGVDADAKGGAAARDARQAPSGPPGKPLAQPLPESLSLGFPYHFRSDRVVQTAKGRDQRIVLVEALGGTAADAARSLRQSMKAAGFKRVPPPADAPKPADGSIADTFVKKGWDGRVRVAIVPAGERTLKHKRAKATVALTFDMPWTGERPAAAASASTPPAG